MHSRIPHLGVAALTVTALLSWPAKSAAQIIPTEGTAQAGQARAVQVVTPLGATVLADTGNLAGPGDARDASIPAASVGSLVGGRVLNAVTMGWPDQVVSNVSLSNVGAQLGTTSVVADFVMATAVAAVGTVTTGRSFITNLRINGVPIAISGQPNQRISILGGQVVVNEQVVSAAGTTVNALHATVAGVADVVIASATAGIQ